MHSKTRSFLPGFCFAISLIFLVHPSRSLNADGNEIWRSEELEISTVSLKHGLACNTQASDIINIHKKHLVPLEPSQKFSSNKTSKALLGLVVQVRGQDYVFKDLEFKLTFRFKGIEKLYQGSWKGTDRSRKDDKDVRVHAKTTDWWIDLEDYFLSSEIDAICTNKGDFVILFHSHRFNASWSNAPPEWLSFPPLIEDRWVLQVRRLTTLSHLPEAAKKH